MKATDPPVCVQQSFKANVAHLWQAITDAEQMRGWYFEQISDFQPQVGFETQFVVESGERQFPHLWKVTRVDEGRCIAYDWSYENYTGQASVEFKLAPAEEGSELTLTCTIQDDFESEIPEFARESCEEGWKYLIQQSLKQYLDGSSELEISIAPPDSASE